MWTIKIHNGSKGPITDLSVNVYVTDQVGQPTEDECVPAKGRISIEQLTRDLMGQAMRGGIGAVEDQARRSPLASLFMPNDINLMGLVDSSSMIPDILNLAMPTLRQHMQAMNDTFPTVLPAGQSTAVVYFAAGQGQVQADIKFDDEAGNHWVRLFGQPPVLTE